MSKTDIELIKTTIIIPAGRSGRNDVMIPLYDTNQLLTCMRAAREDERERMRIMVEKRIYEIEHTVHIQGSGKRVRELNKLLKQLTPCT